MLRALSTGALIRLDLRRYGVAQSRLPAFPVSPGNRFLDLSVGYEPVLAQPLFSSTETVPLLVTVARSGRLSPFRSPDAM